MEKQKDGQKDEQKDGLKDRQTLIYMNLPAMAGSPMNTKVLTHISGTKIFPNMGYSK